MDLDRITRDIKDEEGLRLMPYLCSRSVWTIGYGHAIGKASYYPDGIDLGTAEYLIEHDIELAVCAAQSFVGEEIFRSLIDARQHALVDMAFNLGRAGIAKFKRLKKALIDEDYSKAAIEIMDSQYARQVPNRAKRNRDRMLTGREKEHQILPKYQA